MIKRIFIGLTILLNCFNGVQGQELKKEYQDLVTDFIDCVKSSKIERIADKISYPFEREYPIPTIKNKQEFSHRFNEIIDDSLKQIIINSNPSTDWSAVGWRGIMLNQGILWIDYDGKLRGVNYQSKTEKELKDRLIKEDKANIHSSLSNFTRPVYLLETTEFRIRIDEINKDNYRYASWTINKSMNDKPDLIIENGKLEFQGSGGNHNIRFKNSDSIYECSIIVMGSKDMPPAMFKIYNGDKEVLSQTATIIKE